MVMLLLTEGFYRVNSILFSKIHSLASLNMALMMLYVKSLCVSLREVSFTPAYAGDPLITQ